MVGLQENTEARASEGCSRGDLEQQTGERSATPRDGLLSQVEALLSRVLAAAVVRALGHDRLLEVTHKMAFTDWLTGLFTGRHFDQRLVEESPRAARYGRARSLIMLDIDHFKLYNDRNGHPEGDRILVRVASVLRQSVRATDTIARHAGDESAIPLPETNGERARVVARKVRLVVQAVALTPPTGQTGSARDSYEERVGQGSESSGCQLTVSAGVATCRMGGSWQAELLASADRALYQAKAARRNCVWAPDIEADDGVRILRRTVEGSG
jgi:diguanylate cyclase (GGDEF)-like protein